MAIVSISFKRHNRIKLIKSQCAGLSPNQYFTTNRKRAEPAPARAGAAGTEAAGTGAARTGAAWDDPSFRRYRRFRNHFHFSIQNGNVISTARLGTSRISRRDSRSSCPFVRLELFNDATIRYCGVLINASVDYSFKFVTAGKTKQPQLRRQQKQQKQQQQQQQQQQ